MENPGWFESIESCLTSFQRYVLHRFCNTLLSPTAVLTGFQGMGRKTYLLGLLGLLLISCKCAFVLFCMRSCKFCKHCSCVEQFLRSRNFYFRCNVHESKSSLRQMFRKRSQSFYFKCKNIQCLGN